MDNKVYYGEYSLKHWIDLVLKQNIVLPDYQRYFVWNEKKAKTLIETFKNKQFVPPVTIGAFKIGGTNQNLILDGQQRITSILLAYLGLYPDAQTYKTTIELFANDNDESAEDEDELQLDNVLQWNIKQLTAKGKTKDAILQQIVSGNYKTINFDINDDFLKTTFLGFSYLVPHASDEKEQQKYYSSVFRNINIQGEPLLPQESRASLYFLDQDLVGFFSPRFFGNIAIKVVNTETKADFVRYLSLLSQYHKNGSAHNVARSYKPKMEKFYEEYIYASISNEDSETYGKFSNIIPNKEYENIFSRLNITLAELEIPSSYPSIIDLDTYIFGLIYQIIFQKKKVDVSKKDHLMHEIKAAIENFKQVGSHKKSPNNLGHLRERISQSISIYERFTSNES
ncbi:DUF262 domain-containing protein [Thiothrix winogradskyi]|uniref:DUF262 domain-containing protein n=1 Tax=Thiothrix winogradskyi TaxID=96472 RepID=A0ABY3T437_9GAMM|nr:DUF262 domain-containing protein [Thiothrix winogradskyi]UJS26009.1 DUF262 domain-containing protein [Thiothrix winogradskyi]